MTMPEPVPGTVGVLPRTEGNYTILNLSQNLVVSPLQFFSAKKVLFGDRRLLGYSKSPH